MADDDGVSRTSRLFGWINRHIWGLSTGLVIATIP